MTFQIFPGAPLHQAQPQARALDAWRDAALLVQSRWDDFLVADRASRGGAFAAYMTALATEAAAADELARSHAGLAEAA